MCRRIQKSSFSLVGVFVAIFCCFNPIGSLADAVKLRFCVVKTSHTEKRIEALCPKLSTEEGSQVECVVANDRLNCLRRLSDGDADFAVVEPEDLVLAAGASAEYDILVTHELRLFRNDTHHFAMAALVSRDIRSSSDLMGKSFCHGGFENSDDSTRVFATYFQNWIMSKKCDQDKTLVENEISSLSSFFGSACIPGAWTPDSAHDHRLKSRYKNLCALCDNPAGCYTSDKYHGREGALLCLTENAADVAWVRLEDALRHFMTLGLMNDTHYNYLCPDGTTRNVGRGRPCVWISKPWPVIVAPRTIADRVAGAIDKIGERKLRWQTQVNQLMESYHVTVVRTEILQTPEDFLRRYPGFVTANARTGCRPSRSISWCVASNLEDRKCRLMKDAALAHGIEPPISCIQQPNRSACVNAIITGRSEIFVVQPEEELEARLKGTIPLVRGITNKKQDINVIAILVKNESNYRTIMDLKGARACFTGYRSVGWNAFVDVMAKNTYNKYWNCSDLIAMSTFFKDSCVHGLSELKLKHSIPANLYSLCRRDDEELHSNEATYNCLNSGRGDVAFVSIENAFGVKRGPLKVADGLRPICIDKTANKEETCFLTWTELGTVIANEKMTELRQEEIYSTLLDIDVLFGNNFRNPTTSLSLYGPYDSKSDIIFSGRTQTLLKEADHLQLPRNYAKVVDGLINREKTYGDCSSGNRARDNLYNIIAAIILSIVIMSSTTA